MLVPNTPNNFCLLRKWCLLIFLSHTVYFRTINCKKPVLQQNKNGQKFAFFAPSKNAPKISLAVLSAKMTEFGYLCMLLKVLARKHASAPTTPQTILSAKLQKNWHFVDCDVKTTELMILHNPLLRAVVKNCRDFTRTIQKMSC